MVTPDSSTKTKLACIVEWLRLAPAAPSGHDIRATLFVANGRTNAQPAPFSERAGRTSSADAVSVAIRASSARSSRATLREQLFSVFPRRLLAASALTIARTRVGSDRLRPLWVEIDDPSSLNLLSFAAEHSMARVEKTVFLSYRRTNAPWALAVFQYLTHHGYDVFFDFMGIANGDFERVILENIEARAHFLILLTPSALERCSQPGDWFRREIETAMEMKRNMVPLLLDGFDFNAPGISDQLTGRMAALNGYNGLRVPVEYFDEAMVRLRDKYLNVPLAAVLHPASPAVQRIALDQQAAAVAEPVVLEQELTAQAYFERGFQATDLAAKVRFYSQAIRLKPEYVEAFFNRAVARRAQGDLAGAREDYDNAIRVNPNDARAFNNRGGLRNAQGDLAGAREDYDTAIRVKPDSARAFTNRALVRLAQGDAAGAGEDFDTAIRLKPEYAEALFNRGALRRAQGDPAGAREDYDAVIRLKPDHAAAFYNRGVLREKEGDAAGAREDYDAAIRLKQALKNQFRDTLG